MGIVHGLDSNRNPLGEPLGSRQCPSCPVVNPFVSTLPVVETPDVVEPSQGIARAGFPFLPYLESLGFALAQSPHYGPPSAKAVGLRKSTSIGVHFGKLG